MKNVKLFNYKFICVILFNIYPVKLKRDAYIEIYK